MVRSSLYLLLFFAVSIQVAIAQTKFDSVMTVGVSDRSTENVQYRIQGFVTDTHGNRIAGASVFLHLTNKGTDTDSLGEFNLLSPYGDSKLSVRYLGMKPLSILLHIHGPGVIRLVMQDAVETLKELVITSEGVDKNVKQTGSGIAQLRSEDLKRLPPLFGEVDIIKSIQLLPGVSSVGEGAEGFNVRGGRIDENLVLLDGSQIFNTAHLLGFMSGINADVIDRVVLYKGSIPAQYGGRLSSLLDIESKTGNFDSLTVGGGVGPASGRMWVNGPVVKNVVSLAGSVRLSYSDWLLKLVKNSDIRSSRASFFDFNLSMSYKINGKNMLSVSGYGSHDYFRYAHEFGYEYDNSLQQLTLKSTISEKLFSSFSLSRSVYSPEYFSPSGEDALQIRTGITELHLREDFTYSPEERHTIHLGGEFNDDRDHPEITQPFGEQSTVISKQFARDHGRTFSLYGNDDWELSNLVSLSIGLRANLYQNVGPSTVYVYDPAFGREPQTVTDTIVYNSGVIMNHKDIEPRISIRVNTSKNSSLKFGYDLMHQYIHLISNTAAATPVDLWAVSNTYLAPERGNNFFSGYYRNLKNNQWETSFDVFYKVAANLVEYKDFALLLAEDRIETQLVNAAGRSYGCELFLRKVTGSWTGWISYTFSRSLERTPSALANDQINNGAWFPSNYDKPHTLVIVASRRLGNESSFSCDFNYSTGRPVTAIETSYLDQGTTVPVFSSRNQYRIPDYVRLDLSLTVGNLINRIDDSLVLSIYNFLGRKNAFSVYYQRPDNSPLPQSYRLSILGTVLPSVTYNISL